MLDQEYRQRQPLADHQNERTQVLDLVMVEPARGLV
jgi:hypothetical protein